MYHISDDFIDGIKASFTSNEIVIKHEHFPAGTFAVECLNTDWKVLQRIDSLLPPFKEALSIFFAARDISSAAEAQQAIKVLWDALMMLPVYRLFAKSSKGHLRLLRVCMDEPQLTDDIMTPGSERNKSYLNWLARLEVLTKSIRTFQRNTESMLEGHFDKLPERNASAYAGAYERYQYEMWTDFNMRLEEQAVTGSVEPLEHVQVEFPTHIQFHAVRDPKKPGTATMAESMFFSDLSNLLYTDLYKGLAAGHLPRRCENCGRYFLLTSGYDIRYCLSTAPGETVRTCRQVGAHKKERTKIGSDFVRKEYAKVYRRLMQRKQRGTITVDEWNRQIAQAQDIKARALKGEIGDAELKNSFEKF